MYLDRAKRRINELIELGCMEPAAGSPPCTEEDIASLEQKLGFRLPGVIREFYLWAGREIDSLFEGMFLLGIDDQLKTDFRAEAMAILEKAGGDPSIMAQSFVLEMDYDGQFAYVRADEGDDPPVYVKNELEPIFCSSSRFSDYLYLTVEQLIEPEGIRFIRSLPVPPRLLREWPQVKQLRFSGDLKFPAIPSEIFQFKELRHLNLVDAGLLEVSPRISELAFLQKLDLARNSLTSLPMALAQLDELEELDLADNQLTTVIDVLRKLPALKFCWLSGNSISADELDRIQSELPHLQLLFPDQ